MNLLKILKEYFNNTSKEQILKDWEKTREDNNIGPTAEEVLELTEEDRNFIEMVLNNYHKNMDENHWDGE